MNNTINKLKKENEQLLKALSQMLHEKYKKSIRITSPRKKRSHDTKSIRAATRRSGEYF
jgi:hypothetical protein